MADEEFEDVSGKVVKGAEDIKEGLNDLIEVAQDVDKLFAKISEKQKEAIAVSAIFNKGLGLATKRYSALSKVMVNTAKEMKSVDAVLKSMASTLGVINSASGSMSSGFRSMASGIDGFSSKVSDVDKKFSSLIAGAKELDGRIKKLSTTLPINVSINGLDDVTDMESRFSDMSRGVTVPVSVDTDSKKRSFSTNSTLEDVSLGGNKTQKDKAAKTTGIELAKNISMGYASTLKQRMRGQESGMRKALQNTTSGWEKTGAGADKVVSLSVEIAGNEAVIDFLDKLQYGTEESQKVFETFANEVSADGSDIHNVLEKLVKLYPELSDKIRQAQEDAKDSATAATTSLRFFESQVRKDAKTFGEVFKKTFAQGAVDASRFSDGVGGTAVGVTAAAVAVGYFAEKMSKLVQNFSASALELAKFEVSVASVERSIAGMDVGSLEKMRKELNLTRNSASSFGGFFETVKQGVNELGMSKDKIMDISKALQETFGGDQTTRLKQYVDLLQEIPTLEADLSITASLDDQASAIYGLAKSGKMSVVMDLQSAGLFGGTQTAQAGSETASAEQRAVAASEGIQDLLINKLFPDMSFGFSELVKWGSASVGAITGIVGMLGSIKLFTGSAFKGLEFSNDHTTQLAANRIIQSKVVPNKSISGSGGVFGGKALGGLKGVAKSVGVAGGIALAGTLITSKLDDFATQLESTGDTTGSAGVKLSSSIAKAGVMVATGFSIGGPWGAAIGAAYGLATEIGNITESISKLAEPIETKKVAGSGIMALDRATSAVFIKTAKSGLALERSLQIMKNTFGSLKYELLNTKKAFAVARLESMSQIGGGGQEDFNNTLESLADATKKSFEMQQKDAEKVRNQIMSAGNQGEQRRQALNELHKQEMAAVSEFVSGMRTVIDKMMDNPALVQAGLKAESSGTRLSFAQSGGLSNKDLINEENTQAENLRSKLSETTSASAKGLESAGKTLDVLAEKQAASTARLQKEAASAPKATDTNKAKETYQKKIEQMSQELNDMISKDVSTGMFSSKPSNLEAINQKNAEIEQTKREAKLSDASFEGKKKKGEILSTVMDENGVLDLSRMDAGFAKYKEINEQHLKDVEANNDAIEKSFNIEGIKKLISARSASEEVSRNIQSKEKEKATIESSGGDTTTVNSELKDLQKSFAEKSADFEEASKTVTKSFQALNKDWTEEQAKGATALVSHAEGGLAKFEEKAKQIKGFMEKYSQSVDLLYDREGLAEIGSSLEDAASGLADIATGANGLTEFKKVANEGAKNIQKETEDYIASRFETIGTFGEEIQRQQRVVSAASMSADVGAMVGSGLEERIVKIKEETSLVQQEAKFYQEKLDASKGILEKNKDQVRIAKEDVAQKQAEYDAVKNRPHTKIELVKSEEALGNAKTKLASQTAILSGEEEVRKQLVDKALDVSKGFGKAGEMISKAIDDFAQSATGIHLQRLEDMASSTLEMSEYFGTVAGAAKTTIEEINKVASSRLKAQKSAINESYSEDISRNALRAQAKVLSDKRFKDFTEPQKEIETNRIKAELDATSEAEKRFRIEQAELESIKTRVAFAEKIAQLKKEEVDMQQDLVDEASSFASDFGGTFSTVMSLQKISVNLSRQQLDNAIEHRNTLQSMFDDESKTQEERQQAGLKLYQANIDVAKAQLGLKRKEMGIQKSMMDKLLGAAFGQLSGGPGQRNLGGDAAIMGRNATLMRSDSGMYIPVPGGKPGTIDDRANDRALGTGSRNGPLGDLSNQGGVMSDIANILGNAPDKGLQNDLHDLWQAGLHEHSIHTEDYNLSQMIGISNGLLSNIDTNTTELLSGNATSSRTNKSNILKTKSSLITDGGVDWGLDEEVEDKESHKFLKKISDTLDHGVEKGEFVYSAGFSKTGAGQQTGARPKQSGRRPSAIENYSVGGTRSPGDIGYGNEHLSRPKPAHRQPSAIENYSVGGTRSPGDIGYGDYHLSRPKPAHRQPSGIENYVLPRPGKTSVTGGPAANYGGNRIEMLPLSRQNVVGSLANGGGGGGNGGVGSLAQSMDAGKESMSVSGEMVVKFPQPFGDMIAPIVVKIMRSADGCKAIQFGATR